MHTNGRTTIGVLPVLLAAVAIAATSITAPAAAGAATTLLLGTTYLSDPRDDPNYGYGAQTYYIAPTTLCGVQTCVTKPVVTPQQFWPSTGWQDLTIDESIAQGTEIFVDALAAELDDGSQPVVAFGDSQSSSILTLAKRGLTAATPQQKSRLTFVLVGNPNRPNGGLLERIAPLQVPVLGLTGSGATPTDTGVTTVDAAFQYDGLADFPRYPLNLLADLNVLAGANIHSSYLGSLSAPTADGLISAVTDPANRRQYGDTSYVTIPAKHLPLVAPLRQFGAATGLSAITTPIADLVEPTLAVLVELGYDRGLPYGAPARFSLFPKVDAGRLARDLVQAGAAGVRAALSDIRAAGRPAKARPASAQRGVPRATAATSPAAAGTRTGSAAKRPGRGSGHHPA